MVIIKIRHMNFSHVLANVLPSGVDLLALMLSIMIQGMLLGHYDSLALDAEGTVIQLGFLGFVIFLIFMMGGSILIARRLGEGKIHQANIAFTQSMMFSGIAAVIMAIVAYLLFPVIASHVIGLQQPVIDLGMDLIVSLLPFFVFAILNFMGLSLIRGSGDTFIAMIISIMTATVNIVLAVGMIYGKWGFPELGIKGMGYSLGIAHTLGFILLVIFILLKKTRLQIYPKSLFKLNIQILKRIFKLGYPITIEQAGWFLGFVILQAYVARLPNQDSYTIHQAIFQFLEMISILYQGISMANMSLIGKAIGENDSKAEWSIHRHTRNVLAPLIITMSLILLIFPKQILSLYINDIENISEGILILRLAALLQIPRALAILASSHLRARGDVLWMVKSTGVIVIIWILFVGYSLALPMKLGLTGIWISIMLSEGHKYLWQVRRLKKRAARKI